MFTLFVFSRNHILHNRKKHIKPILRVQENVHSVIVMARIHRLCCPVSVVQSQISYWCDDAVTHPCVVCNLSQCTMILLILRCNMDVQKPEEGKGEERMFRCELFPSVVWSCRHGIQCSRRPYTGPCTWQCISATTGDML